MSQNYGGDNQYRDKNPTQGYRGGTALRGRRGMPSGNRGGGDRGGRSYQKDNRPQY